MNKYDTITNKCDRAWALAHDTDLINGMSMLRPSIRDIAYLVLDTGDKHIYEAYGHACERLGINTKAAMLLLWECQQSITRCQELDTY